MRNFDLNAFVRGYIECALWASTDDNGHSFEHLNHFADDIAPTCMIAMRATCADFAKSNHSDLVAYCARFNEAHAGGDFWLTRNGHGAGFWDRGLGVLGDRLSSAAKVYGTVDLYVGDDDLIYGESS